MRASEALQSVVESEPAEENKPLRFDPGWYRDISNDDYHRSQGVSSSTLKKFLEKTPAHVDYDRKHPRAPSKNMQIGTAVHTLVLEPETVEKEIAVSPVFNLRTKDGKAEKQLFMQANAGKLILNADEWQQAQDMAGNLNEFIQNDEVLAALMANKVCESSIYWWYDSLDPDDQTEYRTMAKVRPDVLSTDYSVIIDLKTTRDATYTEFQKSIINFGYHISAAMYLEGVNQCRELLDELGHFAYTKFIFLVVENEPPYLPAVYELDQAAIDLGKQYFRRAMWLHHKAKAENWPGFTSDIRMIELPPWASRAHII